MKGKRYIPLWRFLDRQIGVEPLVTDWAKEEAR